MSRKGVLYSVPMDRQNECILQFFTFQITPYTCQLFIRGVKFLLSGGN